MEKGDFEDKVIAALAKLDILISFTGSGRVKWETPSGKGFARSMANAVAAALRSMGID